ncbi:MAG: hypothetical protein LBJ59_00310, partial [Zoogloeaceae bacterium]|nr:hypothetical protein [Zoogloeaceae bacterium]
FNRSWFYDEKNKKKHICPEYGGKAKAEIFPVIPPVIYRRIQEEKKYRQPQIGCGEENFAG